MSDPADYAAAYGYVPARRSGNLVFLSGTIGMNEDGTTPDDPREQYRLAFGALGEVLKTEGLGAADIVEMTTFHTRYPDHMDVFIEVKKEFFGDVRTAWTGIGVASLGDPATLVEIRAIAEVSQAS